MNDLNAVILLILGIGVLGGILGASIFQKLRIPEVVGYIVIGLFIGRSGVHVVTQEDLLSLKTFNVFALGLIGFLIGGELKVDTFKQYAGQLVTILLCEGLLAFMMVSVPIALIIYRVTGVFSTAAAAGIVFGAIASATDPASTTNVLWEYRSRGVLTTAIMAIVAMDDALAMTLYGIGTSVADFLASGSISLRVEAQKLTIELLGAVLLGVLVGLLLNRLLRWIPDKDKQLPLALSLILLTIGLSVTAGMDVIIAAMTIGFIVTNYAPRRSKELFGVVRNFSIPIYVMFFVLIGAQLDLSKMPSWSWLVVIVYVVGRGIGKIVGAYCGARLGGSDPVIRSYLGISLLPQGGVAVGLSIMAGQHLTRIEMVGDLSLGDIVVTVVTVTTLLAQLTGPPLVKLAIRLSGDIGRDITEDDIIASWSVSDTVEKNIQLIREGDSIRYIVDLFSNYDHVSLPVIDSTEKLVGMLSLSELKEILPDQDSWDWIVAEDVMGTVDYVLERTTPMKEAVDNMTNMGIEQAPVIDNAESRKPIGIFDLHTFQKRLRKELIDRHQSLPDL